MGDARSEVPMAVLQKRPASSTPAPTPPPAASGSDAGQQEVSSLPDCLPRSPVSALPVLLFLACSPALISGHVG